MSVWKWMCHFLPRYVLLCVYNKSVKIIQYNRLFKTKGVYEEANEKANEKDAFHDSCIGNDSYIDQWIS